MHNSKTYRSFDLSTSCPKLDAGIPCQYCYVLQARQANVRPKQLIDKIEYKDEVLRLRQSTIDKLNSMGGLRMWAFADYKEWMDPHINKLIEDAAVRDLKLKAVTKQEKFCFKYYNNSISIQYSVDRVGNPIPIWRDKYPNILIRAMVRNREDAKYFYDKVDILTPYHGKKISDKYRPLEAKKACAELAPAKTCCKTNSCASCDVKCLN